MPEHKLRCGDTARQEGAEFDIEVAYADYASGYASWCGWPEGRVEISKLALVTACSDEEHRKAVAQWLDGASAERQLDHRHQQVQRLYRPRAYWKHVTEAAERQKDEANRALAYAAQKWVDANAGPADVEPLA